MEDKKVTSVEEIELPKENNTVKKSKKKRLPIAVYSIIMLVVFVLIFILLQDGLAWLYRSVMSGKYGTDVIGEAIWAGLILIVLLLFKNSYIFKQSKIPFIKSIKYFWPELAIGGLFLTIGCLVALTGKVNVNTVVNLGIYCVLIGIFEEFLCRGWLLNEFLERYSDTKKGIICSIIISSVVFGCLHFINLATQDFATTFIQVCNASVSGIFLALIYYKTKNIWACVFTHAFWDFSLMLTSSANFVDCVNMNPQTALTVSSLLQALFLIGAYIFVNIWLFKQTDLAKKPISKGIKIAFPIIFIVTYLFGLFAFTDTSEDDMVCPVYDEVKFTGEYRIETYNFEQYELNHVVELEDSSIPVEIEEGEITPEDILPTQPLTEVYNFVLRVDDNKNLIFENTITKDFVVIAEENDFYDYLLIENGADFAIMYNGETDNLETYVNYALINKSEISNDKSFLENVLNGVKVNYTPAITTMGSIYSKESDTNRGIVITDLGYYMAFDDSGGLNIVNFE